MMPETGADHRRGLNAANAALATSTRLLRDAGLAPVADAAIRRAALRERIPVVVVLGESGQGKSSLVKLLAPHRVELGTEGHLAGLYRVVLPPDGGQKLSGHWILSDQRREPITDERPTAAVGAQFTWDSCALGDVVVIDTPCAGGLGAAQGELNRHLAQDASVAVFVTDAGAALSAAELVYLEACAGRISSLLILVSKIDLFAQSWELTVQDNLKILASRGDPSLAAAKVLGVSTVMASQAGHDDGSTEESALLRASGWPVVLETLTAEVGRSGLAPTENALRIVRTGLTRLIDRLTAEMTVARNPLETESMLRAEEHRLEDLERRRARWTLDLDRDLNQLRTSVARSAAAKVDAWTLNWRERISETAGLRREETSEATAREMFAELQSLRGAVLAEADLEIKKLLGSVFQDFDVPAPVAALSSVTYPESEHRLAGSPSQGFNPTTIMPAMMGIAGGKVVAGALGAFVVAPAGLLAVPLMAVGAGGWTAVNLLYRRNQAAKSRLLNELPRLAQSERNTVVNHVDQTVNTLKPELVVAYRNHLEQAMLDVRRLVHENRAQQERSAAETATRRDVVHRDLATVEDQLTAVDAALRLLRQG